jgi:hypothetical protein
MRKQRYVGSGWEVEHSGGLSYYPDIDLDFEVLEDAYLGEEGFEEKLSIFEDRVDEIYDGVVRFRYLETGIFVRVMISGDLSVWGWGEDEGEALEYLDDLESIYEDYL